jgi:hypothetical protein
MWASSTHADKAMTHGRVGAMLAIALTKSLLALVAALLHILLFIRLLG